MQCITLYESESYVRSEFDVSENTGILWIHLPTILLPFCKSQVINGWILFAMHILKLMSNFEVS